MIADDVVKNPTYDDWKKWLPIYGSYKQAKLDESVGKTGAMIWHSFLAGTDVLLVRSLLGSTLKYAANKGLFSLLNEGYGVFGKKGLIMGNVKIEMLYCTPSAGFNSGTFFSIRSLSKGGFLYRYDYGLIHNTINMQLHSTYRITLGGVQYGSTYTQFFAKPLLSGSNSFGLHLFNNFGIDLFEKK